jgi:hypothetical protein
MIVTPRRYGAPRAVQVRVCPSLINMKENRTMSDLAILSDAELDAVSGGLLNAGAGGAGGINNVGATFANNGSVSDLDSANLSVSGNNINANGGHGGNVSIDVDIRLSSRRRS